jgi:AraC-like DNA-binding protein
MALPDPPYRVRTAGCIDRQRWHSTPGTRGADAMLTVVLAGAGWYRSPAGEMRVGPGAVGMVVGHPAGLLRADPEDPYLHLYCRFGGAYALALAGAWAARAGAAFIPLAHAARVADHLRAMGQLHRTELPASMGEPEVALARALCALASDEPAAAPALTSAALEEHLRARVSEPTDLDAIARHFQVSRSTLCRLSRRAFGIGVRAVHERLKLAWAAHLLDAGIGVGECAARVGFSDRRYFTRVWRARERERPGERAARARRRQR